MAERLAAVVIGAGPAGIGPLVWAMQSGQHETLLRRGVAWISAQDSVGDGAITGYGIGSDTAAGVLLECTAGSHNPLAALADTPAACEVRAYGANSLPLQVAGRFLRAIGDVAATRIARHPPSELLRGRSATYIVAHGPDHFDVHLDDGAIRTARRVVLAMGGRQEKQATLAAQIDQGIRLEEGYAQRSMLTGELFARGGMASLAQRLAGKPDPRLLIIGSSHSALTAAHLLLESGIAFGDGAVTIVFRRRPRVFYPDRQAARDDGYADFDANDICPTTGRVYRLAGLRMAARDLLRQAWGLGGSRPDTRLRLAPIATLAAGELRSLLDAADVVIPAFGYRPNTLPVTSAAGERIALLADGGGRRPMVDAQCRVLTAGGPPLPGVYGIGLASGFVPRGPGLGGEPSFDGQTNGLWLYQNGVGRIVLEQLLG